MSTDLFDQLAADDVPPPPPQFERQVHQRLNRTLLVQHLVDFATGALVWGFMQLVPAAVALIHFSIFGRYPKRPDGNES
ncbi:MAG: hypothetical protein K8T25_13615 [Planctomycetia bacterium]|nr:hypothetical protein [Planctomycetia bacterium]